MSSPWVVFKNPAAMRLPSKEVASLPAAKGRCFFDKNGLGLSRQRADPQNHPEQPPVTQSIQKRTTHRPMGRV